MTTKDKGTQSLSKLAFYTLEEGKYSVFELYLRLF